MVISEFPKLQNEMESFQEKLRLSLEKHKLTLMEIIETYKEDVDGLQVRQQKSQARLNQLVEDERLLRNEIESSEREKDESATRVEVFRLRKQQLDGERAALTNESAQLQHMLSQKHDEIRHKRQQLQHQQQRDIAEANAYSQVLGLDIEAPAPQVLQFIFRRVLESDSNAACEFSLDLSQERYNIIGSRPELPQQVLSDLEVKLNDTGNLGMLLKASRAALIRALESGS
ncbi:LAFA_0G02036g1_1 [Lachancea sp. 'fantastica']|nr:LAFA_0G02036g1_1 [Lachancea sp. 'fantastica']